MALEPKWQIVTGAVVLLAFYLNGLPLFVPSRLDPLYAPKSGFGLIEVEGFGKIHGPEGVDLVFVHGLGSNPDTTWRAVVPSKKSRQIQTHGPDSTGTYEYIWWVRDLLPEDIPSTIRENIRVFHYNYKSHYLRDAPQILLTGLGNALVHDLDMMLGETGNHSNRKLVFVGSSYGGLVVKQALLHASKLSRFRYIASRTSGVIFLGTPHQGSEIAYWGRALARALKVHGSNPDMLEEINLDSPRLRDLHNDFVAIFQNSLAVVNIYETRRKVWKKWGFSWSELTVPERSATYAGPPECVTNHPFALHHFELNKYATRSYEYNILVQHLLKFLQPPPQGFFSVSVELVPTFTPRQLILHDINEFLTKAMRSIDSLHVVVLHGLGGVGKSQLARQLVEQHRKSYKTVFWIDATSTLAITSSFTRFLNDMNPHNDVKNDAPSSLRESTTIKRVKRWISEHHNPSRRWIFILDGADDLSKVEIEAITPEDTNGVMMITSRNPHICGRYITGKTCHSVLVGSLDTDESTDVLLHHLKLSRESLTTEIQDLLITLGELLGNLALAVDLAGAYIVEQSFDDTTDALKMYLSDFLKHRDYLLKRKPFIEISDYNLTVWTVWDKSFNTISLKHPEVGVGHLLTFLSGFDGSNIQDELFWLAGKGFSEVYPRQNARYDNVPTWLENLIMHDDNTWSGIHLREAQSLLERYSLVMRVKRPWAGVKIHNLVQWRAKQVDNFEHYAEWSAIFFLAVVHRVSQEDAPQQFRTTLLMHLSALEESSPGTIDRITRREDIWALRFTEAFVRFLLNEGMWMDARLMLDRVMLIRQSKQMLSLPTCSDPVGQLLNFGAFSLEQGHWSEDVEFLEEVWEFQRHHLSENDHRNLFIMVSLANAYSRLKRPAESLQLRIHVLQILIAEFGVEDWTTVISIASLGTTYLALGDARPAEFFTLKALEIATRVKEINHERMSIMITNLAATYAQQSRWEEAQAMLEGVVEMLTEAYGDMNHLTLYSTSNLACIYWKQKRFELAESLYRYLLVARSKKQPKDDLKTLQDTANLAAVLYEAGEIDEAVRLMMESVSLLRETRGPSHLFTMKFEQILQHWQRAPTLRDNLTLKLQNLLNNLWRIMNHLLLQIRCLMTYCREEQDPEDLWQNLTAHNTRMEP